MKCTIVPMTAAHLEQVAEIERACFADPWSVKMLADHLDSPGGCGLAALGESGEVLGYGGALTVVDEGYITNVAVRPEARRRGVASALLAGLDQLAAERKLAFLTLEVRESNDAARALYTACGYREAGRRRGYYEHPREDAIIMTKEF